MIDKNKIVDEYELSPYTMAILPIKKGDKIYSKIIEVEDEFICSSSPLEIIKVSCEYFGSSFDGRREGTRSLTHITHKAPIVVDPMSNIYIFPTTSPQRNKCIWIAQNHVNSSEPVSNAETIVTFRNKQSLLVPISHTSFANQVQRTTLLQVKLTQRLEEAMATNNQFLKNDNLSSTMEANYLYNFKRFNF